MSPSSIVIPVNTVATFECIAYCTKVCEAVWYIRSTPTANPYGRRPFIQEGFSFPYTPPTDGIYQTTISVNASTSVNNTELWCTVDNDGFPLEYARSDISVLYVLPGICLITSDILLYMTWLFLSNRVYGNTKPFS